LIGEAGLEPQPQNEVCLLIFLGAYI
jgi:hypothetical protein